MDELRRIRELAEEVPEPDPRRKAHARSELLQLAEAERESTTPLAEPERRTRLAELLETWRRTLLRPAPAAGLVALVLAAVAGTVVLLTGPGSEPPAELADPGDAPEAPAEPDRDASDEGSETDTEADSGTDSERDSEADITLAASCTDPEGRVTVAYPDDWDTPESGEPGACRYFDDEEIEVDAAIGGTPLAELQVSVVSKPFDEVAAPGVARVEVEREEFAVDGRPALRQRLEATGEGAAPEGVLVERMLVDLDGETLVLTVEDEDARVLDDRRPLLEAMVRSVEFHDDQ